jgi:hypothetical protein
MFALLNRYGDRSFTWNASEKFIYFEFPMILTVLQVVIWFIFTFGPDRNNFVSGWSELGTGYPLVELPFYVDCKTLICFDNEKNLRLTKIFLSLFQLCSSLLLNLSFAVPVLERHFPSEKKNKAE